MNTPIPVLVTNGRAETANYNGQVLVGVYWLANMAEADRCVQSINTKLSDKGYQASIMVPKEIRSVDSILWDIQL